MDYRYERVYTLREFLDSAYQNRIVVLIELKKEAGQSLLNSNKAIRDRAWSELVNPVRERHKRQEIMMYSHDPLLQNELLTNFTNAGLRDVVDISAPKNKVRRPWWRDTVAWQEPSPSAVGNYASWKSAIRSTNALFGLRPVGLRICR